MATTHGASETEPVVGAGDRKKGSAIKPGEQLFYPPCWTCWKRFPLQQTKQRCI